MELMLGNLCRFDRFESSDSNMQSEKLMPNSIQQVRSKVQPGGRCCDRPFFRSKNGLISFASDGLREASNIRWKRYFADFVKVDRSIEPDQTTAFIANLQNSTLMAVD